jgi:hypothetical protein
MCAAQLNELTPFLTGLEQDHDAAVAGPTFPYGNGLAEGRQHQDEVDRTADVRVGFIWPRRRAADLANA